MSLNVTMNKETNLVSILAEGSPIEIAEDIAGIVRHIFFETQKANRDAAEVFRLGILSAVRPFGSVWDVSGVSPGLDGSFAIVTENPFRGGASL